MILICALCVIIPVLLTMLALLLWQCLIALIHLPKTKHKGDKP